MSNTLGVYGYILWGEKYDMPYVEALNSVEEIADEIVVVTDPRFKDNTLSTLGLMARERPKKMRVYSVELDLNDPNIDGATKAMARSKCQSDILMQMDFDEVVRDEDLPKIRCAVDLWPSNVKIIGTGVVNWFNGEHFKLGAAGWHKERLSINSRFITHGIPLQHRVQRGGYIGATEDSDGAGYIDISGNSMVADKWWCNVGKPMKIPRDILNPNFVWLHHYSWYSVTRKWSMNTTWHYFWGLLHGRYNNLEEYTENLDGDGVDFWNPVIKSPSGQMEALEHEMEDRSIRRNRKVEHPPVMRNWVKRQPVYSPSRWGGLISEVKRNI